MQGDFSVLKFDPRLHERAVSSPAQGVLRNVNGVLHQQGRVTTDADLTEGELLELGWNAQAGQDVIGPGVCAVPAADPQGFRVESALVVGTEVHVMLRPGRAWVDGILTRLPGVAPDPKAGVERVATYFGSPFADPAPVADQIGDGTRDAVILEVSEESLHGYQYPEQLIEAALGGPDTSERAYVNHRVRLLRLADGEDCKTAVARLSDDPSAKGHLTVSLAPVVAIAGDCPVVGGGGYTGFEHNLYRIEIADVPLGAPARFKWSQWNGGLVGRGRFDSTTDPDRVTIDAGRAAIVSSGLTEFYLEALAYDPLHGEWRVIYGTAATLNTDHDLELASPPSFGAIPSTTAPVFFRLWNGIADIFAFIDAVNPVELRDGIRLAFDGPVPGNYRPGDYWTFTVRAGEIQNSQVLLDDAAPAGIVYHRVALAEIDWTGRRNTTISGTIEDCRTRFRPLTNQKICCTLLVGDGVSSFGDFNSLEEAAEHLPAAGGELCLLPGLHRANLRLEGRRSIKIHGCRFRSMVLPRTETRAAPILHFVDCVGVEVCDLDLLTYDGIAVRMDGSTEGACRRLSIRSTRVVARTNAIRATNVAELTIAENRLHLLDTIDGRAVVSIAADDALIERNTLLLLLFVDQTPDEPDEPDDDPTRDPADPCARPEVLYRFPHLLSAYAFSVWTFLVAALVPKQPYRAIGGIHLRPGCERVRVLENEIKGGAGNGITLGGDLDPAEAPAAPPIERPDGAPAGAAAPAPAAVNVTATGQFLTLVQDEAGRPLSDVDVFLEAEGAEMDRSDVRGMASVKAAPGTYALHVSPAYRITRVAEARDEGVLVNVITLAARAGKVSARGFLHDIVIDKNDVSMMGLSGIGFALHAGARVPGVGLGGTTSGAKDAVLAGIDAALANLALAPLLRASDPLRDLTISRNHLHHNLQNPFTESMLAEAQAIGRGGVSLPVVDSAVIDGNRIHENGVRAVDPSCGIFVGYGNDLDISSNVLSGNGAATSDFVRNRRSGIRGGIFVRFAAALTKRFSSSSGGKPAMRAHDNRVDQPAGRALTAFAFGPVSVASNHLNSEHTGLFGLLDLAVGSALIVNLGGIHRVLARRSSKYLGSGRVYAAAAELALPGGETMFDDNYVRLGLENRSLTSQVVFAFDDVGYSANTSSVYRSDPFFANTVVAGDTVRATSSRFREDANRTISLLTEGSRMNTTALNQADHCVVVRPLRSAGGSVLPTVDAPNQVLDFAFCGQQFAQPSGLRAFLLEVLAAYGNQLGGTLTDESFSTAELEGLSRKSTARALSTINATQVATTRAYQHEAARMAEKRGAAHPTTVSLSDQASAGVEAARLLTSSAEAASITAPTPDAKGAALSGRFVNERGQGLADHHVELLGSDGAKVATVGVTDGAGYFTAVYDDAQVAAFKRHGDLFARVVDPAGKEALRDKTPLHLLAGSDVRTTLVVPVRVVPLSVAVNGTVIFGPAMRPPSPPAPAPAPAPPTRAPSGTPKKRR